METVFSAKAWATVWQYRATFMSGLMNTLRSAVVGLLIAMVIGFALGLMATGSKKSLRVIARVYVEFFQNTPLILQVCFLYYALAYSGVKITVVTIGFISLGLYHGAYVAEVVRAGIQSIPQGQYEAASSLGMSYVQTMFTIILPQTVRRVIPTVTSDFITTFKDTSLLSSVGVMELMMFSKNLTTVSGNITPYVAAGIFYLIVTLPLIKVVSIVENRIARSERGEGPRPKAKAQLKEAADVQ